MMNKRLSVEMQCLGVRIPDQLRGRSGGAGPAEGLVLIVDGTHINVPARNWFVKESPFEVLFKKEAPVLYKNGKPLCEICLPERPQFYDQRTTRGVPLEKIALLHGRDCLASTVYQNCVFWGTDAQCLFCGIGLSLESRATVCQKSPEDIGAAAEAAQRFDSAAHMTLTSGTRENDEATIVHLAACAGSVKARCGMPVHVQICPTRRPQMLKRLKDAGVDTIGIHIETFPIEFLKRVAPGKAAAGMKAYLNCWEDAVAVFGHNQVSSFVIVGLGESPGDVLELAELLCSRGVFPFLLPLRPVPGSKMEKFRPPEPGEMLPLYEAVSEMLVKNGLSTKNSKAGCVRCGACSSQALFEMHSCADSRSDRKNRDRSRISNE